MVSSIGRRVRIPSAVCRMRAAASSAVSPGSKNLSLTYDLVPHLGTVPRGAGVGTTAASAARAGGGAAGRRAESAAVATIAVDAATASRRVADCGTLARMSAAPSGDDGGRRRFEGEGEAEEDVVVLEQRMRCLASVAIAGEAQSVGVEWSMFKRG
jgi:hypothetical protein